MSFQPNWASAPGNTINEILIQKNISKSEFGKYLGQNNDYIEKLLKGKVSINNQVANQLKDILGVSEDFWIKRDEQYRESLGHINALWLKDLPVNDMIKLGWIKKTSSQIEECLRFFDVDDVSSWKEKYNIEIGNTSFRTSSSFSSQKSSISAWLRQGEIVTSQLLCKPWNKDLFIDKIENLKKLTRIKSPKEFIPKLIEECAECGVAVGIVRTPQGCRASGAAKFLNKDRAILLLSMRYLSDDHFWFTFFHEAGHLILHGNSQDVYVEMENKIDRVFDEKEDEANIFAAEVLIPFTLHDKLKSVRSNKRKIIQLAQLAGVSPGIVVGQMQFLGYIKYQYLNSYKRRYKWEDINLKDVYKQV